MVETETRILQHQYFSRCIPDRTTLEVEAAASEQKGIAAHIRISWMFASEMAGDKRVKAYPEHDVAVRQFKW